MQMIRMILVAMTVVALPISTSALANDKATVQSLYNFLSNPGSKSHAQAFRANVADSWKSIGNYSGKNKTAPAFIGQLGHFAKVIPDLSWKVEEMRQGIGSSFAAVHPAHRGGLSLASMGKARASPSCLSISTPSKEVRLLKPTMWKTGPVPCAS